MKIKDILPGKCRPPLMQPVEPGALNAGKILVFRACRTLQLKEMIDALAKQAPQAKVDVVCHEPAVPSLDQLPGIGHLFPYPRGRSFKPGEMPEEMFSEIRSRQYDLIIIPFNNPWLDGYEELMRLVKKIAAGTPAHCLGFSLFSNFFRLPSTSVIGNLAARMMRLFLLCRLKVFLIVKGFKFKEEIKRQ